MLVEFRVTNFKCFRDEQVFSLVASADRSLPDNVIDAPGGKLGLLRSCVVYGPNASGKTSLLEALVFFKHFVVSSAKMEPDDRIDVKPFLLDRASADAPSSFEATFLADDTLFRYGFMLTADRVQEEWLLSYPKGRQRKLFKRFATDDGKPDFEFGTHLKGELERLSKLTRTNALFLSVAAAFNHEQLMTVFRWFSKGIDGTKAERMDPKLIVPLMRHNERLSDAVTAMLKWADLGIVDLSLTEGELSIRELSPNLSKELRTALQVFLDAMPKDAKSLNLSFNHRASEGTVPLSIEDESSGTCHFLALSYLVQSALARGTVLFVDELDASLHPLLVRRLVELFHDPRTNPKNAQLIFNTHDTTLLSSDLFRRDQIWFVEKDTDGASCAYSLLEFSPRKGEALEKGYLQGRYGAIPFLGGSIEEFLTDGSEA